MPWYDVFAPLPAIVEELRLIRLQLTRIANAQEGIPVVVPPRPDAVEVPTLAGASSDRDYAQIEAIEQRYLAISGRLPTEEEIDREILGEEVPQGVLTEALAAYRRVRESPHVDD